MFSLMQARIDRQVMQLATTALVFIWIVLLLVLKLHDRSITRLKLKATSSQLITGY